MTTGEFSDAFVATCGTAFLACVPTLLPAPSGANQRSLPRAARPCSIKRRGEIQSAPMASWYHVAPALDPYFTFSREHGAGRWAGLAFPPPPRLTHLLRAFPCGFCSAKRRCGPVHSTCMPSLWCGTHRDDATIIIIIINRCLEKPRQRGAPGS